MSHDDLVDGIREILLRRLKMTYDPSELRIKFRLFRESLSHMDQATMFPSLNIGGDSFKPYSREELRDMMDQVDKHFLEADEYRKVIHSMIDGDR